MGLVAEKNVTAPNGETAMITEYDEFDRPVGFKHYDGTIFKVSYVDFNAEPLVSLISVPSSDITLGKQEYDGLSRTTSRTVNGVKIQFGYKEGFVQPSRRVNARGQTILLGYIPELEMQATRVASFAADVPLGVWDDSSRESETVFTYSKKSDASHGRILSASSSNCHYSYSYTKSGAVKSTTQTVGQQSQTVANQKFTMAGKPFSVKIGDRNIFFEYDEYGELISTTDGDIKVEMNVDDFGRLSNKAVKQYNPTARSYNLVQSTEISL